LGALDTRDIEMGGCNMPPKKKTKKHYTCLKLWTVHTRNKKEGGVPCNRLKKHYVHLELWTLHIKNTKEGGATWSK